VGIAAVLAEGIVELLAARTAIQAADTVVAAAAVVVVVMLLANIAVAAVAVVAGVVRCYLKQTAVDIEDLCCYYIAD
jgi:hypothetical protein